MLAGAVGSDQAACRRLPEQIAHDRCDGGISCGAEPVHLCADISLVSKVGKCGGQRAALAQLSDCHHHGSVICSRISRLKQGFGRCSDNGRAVPVQNGQDRILLRACD